MGSGVLEFLKVIRVLYKERSSHYAGVNHAAGYRAVFVYKMLVKFFYQLKILKTYVARIREIIPFPAQQVADYHGCSGIGSAVTVGLSGSAACHSGCTFEYGVCFTVTDIQRILQRGDSALGAAFVLFFVFKSQIVCFLCRTFCGIKFHAGSLMGHNIELLYSSPGNSDSTKVGKYCLRLDAKKEIMLYYMLPVKGVVIMQNSEIAALKNKVVWVTGSSRGIGKAIAEHFASRGAKVAIHGSRPDSPAVFKEGKSLAANAEVIAETYGVPCIAVTGDLTDLATVEKLVSEIHAKLGPVDILVNCAGGDIGSKGVQADMAGKPEGNDALSISIEDIHTVMNRNFLTCVLCCKVVAPDMMARKSGKIINIGSIAGLKGLPGAAIYASSKAAVHEYSRCLAVQLRPYDITVNVVAPGDTVTERFLASRETSESQKVHTGTLERYGWPEEVAAAVEFFATSASSFITGEVLRVDGGSQCWPS